MKTEELRERCSRFFSFFDLMKDINNSPYEGVEDFPISHFVYEWGHIYDDTEDEDHEMENFQAGQNIAFVLGFIIGHEFDVTYPEAQADIEAIKQEIREKGLLPYLPRERRATP